VRIGGGHDLGHAQVSERRFFLAGQHLDRVAEQLLGGGQEHVAVARHAQRGSGHHAHRRHAVGAQARAHRTQGVEGGLHRVGPQAPLGVERGGQVQRRVGIVERAQLAVFDGPDQQAETVGAEDQRGVDGGGCAHHADSGVGNGATIAGLDDGPMTAGPARNHHKRCRAPTPCSRHTARRESHRVCRVARG
jgi:hypothetical protein